MAYIGVIMISDIIVPSIFVHDPIGFEPMGGSAFVEH